MKRTEHKSIIDEILKMSTPDNQARTSELLTQLSEDYEQTLTASDKLTTENATLTEKNEKLRAVNADLFLKVGTPKKEENGGNNNNNNEQEGNDKEMSFESLFNEKGDLL